jgi:hypothetical protein
MRFRKIVPNMKGRGKLFTALFAVATALVAFGFFQGFEVNTSNWFPFPVAAVTVVQVPSGNTSSDYNGNGTSPYASGINAASGNFFGRVKSGVSTQNCTIDTSGPGSNHSLLCEGPFTSFGITAPAAFPAGGYTTQLDIYLDVDYANKHPDCGTASPIGAPCTPNMPA